jgi:hypothetical protein
VAIFPEGAGQKKALPFGASHPEMVLDDQYPHDQGR